MKSTAYIYIRFKQNLDEKSYISAKIEAVTAMFFGVSDVAWLDVVFEMKPHYASMVYYRAFQ